ncbi:BA14K family protein [Stenotrophomonas maltophilia]|nr:BA14K family protein [Stenotrophomonas maltophilia]
MFLKTGRTALLLAAATQVLVLMPYSGDAHAQRSDRYNPQWNQDYRDRDRDDWQRRERERERDRERERRHDAKTTGVVVGVVGAAVVAGVIAAAAKRERETRERADYCMNRYGNYDRRTDSYRDRDGYTYPCR